MSEIKNETSLDTLCGSLCEIMGIAPPEHAVSINEKLVEYANGAFEGEKADRVIMYNPDAIGQWLYEKYPELFCDVQKCTDVEIPMLSPMPPVTPVCFATMYSGAQPEVHGIQKYEKYPLTIDTIFDALIRAGRKPAIIASPTCTVGVIFKEREMDYFTFGAPEPVAQMHAKLAELILEDKHDFIVVHAFNYDSSMHKNGTESIAALSEIRVNSAVYSEIDKLVRQHWKGHNVLMGFGMDHGCHDTDSGAGTHCEDSARDRNITHLYKAYKKEI